MEKFFLIEQILINQHSYWREGVTGSHGNLIWILFVWRIAAMSLFLVYTFRNFTIRYSCFPLNMFPLLSGVSWWPWTKCESFRFFAFLCLHLKHYLSTLKNLSFLFFIFLKTMLSVFTLYSFFTLSSVKDSFFSYL